MTMQSDNYLTTVRSRLDRDLDAVVQQEKPAKEFVDFIIEELRCSFKNGVQVGRTPRKKTYSKGSRPQHR